MPHFNDPSLIGILGTIAAAIAAVYSHLNRSKLANIEITVNGRLDRALAEVAQLKHEIKLLKAKPKDKHGSR